MAIIVRLLQAWPLIVVLGLLAVVVYFVVSWAKSPTRAKEVLIKLFTVLTGVLAVLFTLASLYAFFEHNINVLELVGSFDIIVVVALLITRICRWRFVKNHPNYKDKPEKTDWI